MFGSQRQVNFCLVLLFDCLFVCLVVCWGVCLSVCLFVIYFYFNITWDVDMIDQQRIVVVISSLTSLSNMKNFFPMKSHIALLCHTLYKIISHTSSSYILGNIPSGINGRGCSELLYAGTPTTDYSLYL